MITAIRSALICDKVEATPEGLTNYHGIHGNRLVAGTRPGLLQVWLTLHLELDKRRSAGAVILAAPDLEMRVPFDVTTDRGLTVIAFPVLIPVLAAGVLTVTVTDEGRRDKPFRFRWNLDIAPAAREVEGDVAVNLVEERENSSSARRPRRPRPPNARTPRASSPNAARLARNLSNSGRWRSPARSATFRFQDENLSQLETSSPFWAAPYRISQTTTLIKSAWSRRGPST